MQERTAGPDDERALRVLLDVHLDRQPVSGRLRTPGGGDEPFVGWLGFVEALAPSTTSRPAPDHPRPRSLPLVASETGLPLLERERELVALDDALAAARDGHGGSCCWRRPPGSARRRARGRRAGRRRGGAERPAGARRRAGARLRLRLRAPALEPASGARRLPSASGSWPAPRPSPNRSSPPPVWPLPLAAATRPSPSSTACTGSSATSPTTAPWRCSSTTCTGAMPRRCAS